MEGLFLLIIIGFVAYLAINSSPKAATKKPSFSPKNSNDYDIPDYLRGKWEREDKKSQTALSKNSKSKRVMSSTTTAQNLWKTTQSANERLQKRSKEAQERNTAQTEMFKQSGKGQPIDKNNQRRADWGKRGHLSGGWLQPIFISLISAAALASLFAAT